MKPVKAKCEVCEHMFRVQMLTARLSNRVDKHYFICPSCKTEFISYYSNREMRRAERNFKFIQRFPYMLYEGTGKGDSSENR